VETEDVSSREELERQVVSELLSQGDHSEHEKDLRTLVMDIKNAVKSGDLGELDSFDGKLRELSMVVMKEKERKE